MENNSQDIYIQYNSECTETSVPDRESDPWDRASTSSTHEVIGLSLKKNEDYYFQERLPVDFEVMAGDILFLVYDICSTGDSFGHDAGAYIHFLDLFKSEEKAIEAMKVIENAASRTYDRYDKTQNKFSYISESGKEIEISTWSYTDYFGGLDDVKVEGFIVE